MEKLLKILLLSIVTLSYANKGFSQALLGADDNYDRSSKTSPNADGKRYLPLANYNSNEYTLENLVRARHDAAYRAEIGIDATAEQLDAAIEEIFAHYVRLDNLTIEGTTPEFSADLLDSCVRHNWVEYRQVKFPNTNYMVSAYDTKTNGITFGSGASAGTFSVGCINPNMIPGIDNAGSYHLWAIEKGNCLNLLKERTLDLFPSLTPVFKPSPSVVIGAGEDVYVPGKTITIGGDTIIEQGDVILKQSPTYVQQQPQYQQSYDGGYQYQSEYQYPGGGCFGNNYGGGLYASASVSFGFGGGGGYQGYGGECSTCGWYGPYGHDYGYYTGNCGGGGYGGGTTNNYYDYSQNYWNSFNDDHSIHHSFNHVIHGNPIPVDTVTDYPGQQGGGYTDNGGGNNGGGGAGDVPGQQGAGNRNANPNLNATKQTSREAVKSKVNGEIKKPNAYSQNSDGTTNGYLKKPITVHQETATSSNQTKAVQKAKQDVYASTKGNTHANGYVQEKAPVRDNSLPVNRNTTTSNNGAVRANTNQTANGNASTQVVAKPKVLKGREDANPTFAQANQSGQNQVRSNQSVRNNQFLAANNTRPNTSANGRNTTAQNVNRQPESNQRPTENNSQVIPKGVRSNTSKEVSMNERSHGTAPVSNNVRQTTSPAKGKVNTQTQPRHTETRHQQQPVQQKPVVQHSSQSNGGNTHLQTQGNQNGQTRQR